MFSLGPVCFGPSGAFGEAPRRHSWAHHDILVRMALWPGRCAPLPALFLIAWRNSWTLGFQNPPGDTRDDNVAQPSDGTPAHVPRLAWQPFFLLCGKLPQEDDGFVNPPHGFVDPRWWLCGPSLVRVDLPPALWTLPVALWTLLGPQCTSQGVCGPSQWLCGPPPGGIWTLPSGFVDPPRSAELLWTSRWVGGWVGFGVHNTSPTSPLGVGGFGGSIRSPVPGSPNPQRSALPGNPNLGLPKWVGISIYHCCALFSLRGHGRG